MQPAARLPSCPTASPLACSPVSPAGLQALHHQVLGAHERRVHGQAHHHRKHASLCLQQGGLCVGQRGSEGPVCVDGTLSSSAEVPPPSRCLPTPPPRASNRRTTAATRSSSTRSTLTTTGDRFQSAQHATFFLGAAGLTQPHSTALARAHARTTLVPNRALLLAPHAAWSSTTGGWTRNRVPSRCASAGE